MRAIYLIFTFFSIFFLSSISASEELKKAKTIDELI